jgi:hypothetical protein
MSGGARTARRRGRCSSGAGTAPARVIHVVIFWLLVAQNMLREVFTLGIDDQDKDKSSWRIELGPCPASEMPLGRAYPLNH